MRNSAVSQRPAPHLEFAPPAQEGRQRSLLIAIAAHAALRPRDTALVADSRSWSWAELRDAIEGHAQVISDTDPTLPTFSDSALHGLARLHLGWPIIGTTSGSTAAAKRYRRSQQSWMASFAADQHEFAITPKDVVIAPGSLSHSLFSYALCQALAAGAETVLSDTFRPDRVLQQIATRALIALPPRSGPAPAGPRRSASRRRPTAQRPRKRG